MYLHSKVDWLLIKTLFKSPFFSVRICEDKRDMFSVVTWWRMAGRFLLTIPQISSLWILLCLLILGVFWWMDGWMDSRYLATFSVYFISVIGVVPLLCYFMNYSGPQSGRYLTPENWLNCGKLLLHHKLRLSSPVLFKAMQILTFLPRSTGGLVVPI